MRRYFGYKVFNIVYSHNFIYFNVTEIHFSDISSLAFVLMNTFIVLETGNKSSIAYKMCHTTVNLSTKTNLNTFLILN